MENWIAQREQIGTGTLALPLDPSTRLQMIAVDDIGAVADLAFEHPGHWQGRAVELAGDELSMTDLAAAFSRVMSREVRYQQVPWNLFEQKVGPDLTKMFRWFQDTGTHVDISAVRSEHSSLMSFDRWVQSKWLKVQTAG